ncbi:MAG: ParB/RepB/Spo0J family partition protein [Candidatus Pacebacteria bacterium]|nr:ParB/RepB/Spo0J family partition protein [Candidatus Paceibacterota bacterium]
MSKKLFGLGKGLGSLIPDTVAEAVNNKRETIYYVEVAKIQANPDQPRTDFDQAALQDLSKSIRKFGVLQPLLVTKIEEDLPRGRAVRYQLIAGERRWRAAQLAGLPQVPVIIRDDLTPENSGQKSNSLEVALIENVQREDLNPIETSEAYVRLANEFGFTQQEIGEKVGKSREAVANVMRLVNLPKYIKDATRAGQITGTAARALLSFQTEAAQRHAFEQLTKDGFSTKDMEYAASAAKAAVGRRVIRHNAKYDDLMRNLQTQLGAPVVIRTHRSTSDAGQIVIRFASLEHLNGVVKKIIDSN